MDSISSTLLSSMLSRWLISWVLSLPSSSSVLFIYQFSFVPGLTTIFPVQSQDFRAAYFPGYSKLHYQLQTYLLRRNHPHLQGRCCLLTRQSSTSDIQHLSTSSLPPSRQPNLPYRPSHPCSWRHCRRCLLASSFPPFGRYYAGHRIHRP